MITDDEKSLIRECMASLRGGIDGFRSRRPQMKMIAAVSRTLARCKAEADTDADLPGGNIAVIEAGTGTGKSFGALVPALVMARARGKHLVVSSSTVALQAQYAEKDAPTLQKLLPFPFKVAVAKGRRRYACTLKLFAEADDIHAQDGLALSGMKDPAEVARRQRDEAVMAMALAFHEGRWTGDRDEFAQQVSDRVWSEVSTDRSGCAGKDCPRRGACPFYAARQRVQDADLVVANHDLVLSAIAMGGGGVLPAPAETVYVFDEAHGLSAKAIEHFAQRHVLRGARDWLADSQRAVRDAVTTLRLDKRLLAGVAGPVKELDDGLAGLFRFAQGSTDCWRRGRFASRTASCPRRSPGSAPASLPRRPS